jgi:endonuclease G
MHDRKQAMRSTHKTLPQAARRLGALVLTLATSLVLQACGGGGADTVVATPVDPLPQTTTPAPATGHRIVTLDHGVFRLSYDCDAHTALRWDYTLTADSGNAARPTVFHLGDPTLPAGCGEQRSAGTYAASISPGYDRGHLVPANHMDQDDATIAQSFYMTNIVPQRASFNRGIWADTEDIAECYRDLAPVQVVGGLVYDDTSNDAFLADHAIATPDWFWKVLVTTDPATGATRVIAWLIPNSDGLGLLDSYLVSVTTLEARVGAAAVGLPGLPAALKAQQPAVSWPLPAGCLLG